MPAPHRQPGESISAFTSRMDAYWQENPPQAPHINQRPDQDQIKISSNLDQDRSRSSFDKSDPDGLNSQIKGRYADLLKGDPDFLMARAWGAHPRTLTAGIQKVDVEWVRKQIQFVATKKEVEKKGHYLSAILSRNKF